MVQAVLTLRAAFFALKKTSENRLKNCVIFFINATCKNRMSCKILRFLPKSKQCLMGTSDACWEYSQALYRSKAKSFGTKNAHATVCIFNGNIHVAHAFGYTLAGASEMKKAGN
jgi:hypothetical protein